MQVDAYKKRLDEENRRAEEQERRRHDKNEERKKALEDWHKNKVTNEKGIIMPGSLQLQNIVLKTQK